MKASIITRVFIWIGSFMGICTTFCLISNVSTESIFCDCKSPGHPGVPTDCTPTQACVSNCTSAYMRPCCNIYRVGFCICCYGGNSCGAHGISVSTNQTCSDCRAPGGGVVEDCPK